MWHMPGHTYSGLKRYEDAVWQQEASSRVDHAYMSQAGLLPDQIHNYAHNQEWMIRNLIHVGRVHQALALARNMIENPRHPRFNTATKGSGSLGRKRLLDVLSRHELWDELIALSGTPYLEPAGDELDQILRLRLLGRAYFGTGERESGRAQLALLEERAAEHKSAVETAVTQAEEKVRAEVCKQPANEAPSGTTETALSDEDTKKIEKAKEDARKPFANKTKALDGAVSELKGWAAAAAGEFAEAVGLLKGASEADPLLTAHVHVQAGQPEEAEKLLQEQVEKHKNEVLPLAHLARVQWETGKYDEAKETFNGLREMCGAADLNAPAFARLASLAAELGLSENWGVPRERPEDFGERPPLDTLGPLLWSPATAPTWALEDAEGAKHSLAEYRGRPVVMIFYLGFGCLHCVEQLHAFSPRVKEFADAGISLVAVSTEDRESLKTALANYSEGVFPFPLLADPAQEVFRSYGALDEFKGEPLHGTFLIDAEGRLRWHDIGTEPFMDATFVLEESKRLLSLEAGTTE